MQTQLIISLEEFPEEGRYLSGELDAAIFGIDSAALHSTGPLRYELEAQLFETELVLRGSISAPFELRCDRCLNQFPYTVELEELAFSYDVKGKLTLDITMTCAKKSFWPCRATPNARFQALNAK